jgi:lysophospholipase L1-like esterase
MGRIILLFLFLFGCSSQAKIIEPPQPRQTIVIFGDSILAGLDQSYFNTNEFLIINRGVANSRMNDVYAQTSNIEKINPDYIIISSGINDSWKETGDLVIEKVELLNYLLQYAPVFDLEIRCRPRYKTWTLEWNNKLQDFNSRTVELINRVENIHKNKYRQFYPVDSIMKDNTFDGLHPGKTGLKILADEIKRETNSERERTRSIKRN